MVRPFLVTALTVIVVITLISSLVAETTVGVSGQVRVRSEFDDRMLEPKYTGRTFTLMRTRVNIDANVDDNAQAFIQFQDSRTFGANSQSGTLDDGKNVDIHQAYVRVKRLWGEGWGGQAGRFEVNFGNQRVFGGVGWHNVSRSWEGGLLWYENAVFTATAFSLKALELDDSLWNHDFDIFGVHVDVIDPNLEFFFSYEYNADMITVASADSNDLDRMTFGGYYNEKFDEVDVEFNGAYQTGKISDRLDIDAFMFTGEVGYTFPGEGKARIAAGIDYTSGAEYTSRTESDADSTSGDDDLTFIDPGTYNNLYYTGHKFRGYMDYFVESNLAGLMDLMLRGQISPAPGWLLKGDFHLFTTAQNYIDPLDNTRTTKDVGMEIDITLITKTIKGVSMAGGASFFLPKDSWAGMRDPETGIWLYQMTTVNFK